MVYRQSRCPILETLGINGLSERSDNRHFRPPHSHLTPSLQRTPANIHINLILLSLRYISATDSLDLSSNFCDRLRNMWKILTSDKVQASREFLPGNWRWAIPEIPKLYFLNNQIRTALADSHNDEWLTSWGTSEIVTSGSPWFSLLSSARR